MELIPHIDVAESRIAAILAEPGNHSWPAIDCEALDGWVPDLGLTGYANYSIYRPPAVVAAGITTTVRHRFRVPVKSPPLPGTYFLGAVIYDRAGEEFALELSLGAETVGRIEVRRHDNRRHLIVIDRPIVFDDRVKWVQFASSARGECRIECFVLLQQAPEPSDFAPVIERLHVGAAQPTTAAGSNVADGLRAVVHCITYPPATVDATVTATAPPGTAAVVARAHPDGPSTLHAIELPDLPRGERLAVHLLATEPGGRTAESSCELDTGPAESAVAGTTHAPVTVAVELCHVGRTAVPGMPLTFGVPVARGVAPVVVDASLVRGDGGQDGAGGQQFAAAQARIHSRWPDGSARWVLIDTTVPPALAAGERLACQVRLNRGQPAEAEARDTLRTEHQPDCAICVSGPALRVCLAPGAGDWLLLERPAAPSGTAAVANVARFAGGRLADVLQLTLADDVRLTSVAGKAAVEHAGARRVTLRCDVLHRDAEGRVRVRSELRIHVFATQPFVKLDHRLVIVSADPHAAAAFDAATEDERTLLSLRSCELQLPCKAVAVSYGGEQHDLSRAPWSLRHEHDLAHEVATESGRQQRDGRAPGHARVRSEAGDTLVVGVRNFWQTYPKGIAIDGNAIHVELLPALSGEQLPGDDDAWQRLYRWLQDGRYLLREGTALTTEILLGLPADESAATAAPMYDWLESPVVVRPDLAHANDSGALPRLAPKPGSPQPRYEQLAADALQLLREDRERWRAYGHINFGDWYGEGDWSWGNNEYDTPYCAYWEFLRGGEPGWAVWGAEAARHLADVDTVNSFHDARHIGLQAMHMPAHLGGYLPPFFRSKVAGTRGLPSHMWAEGALLHYLLTGDEAVRESLTRSAHWLLQPERLDHYDFTAVREAGWHLIHLSTIAAATNDRRALDGAAIVVRRILEKQDDSGAWTRMLTSGHCWCGYPHCRGNIAFMVTVLLSGLKRYYDLTGERSVAEAITAGGRWLVRETFNADTGWFIGGTCTTMKRLSEGSVFGTQIIIEGVADAYAVSRDPEIGRCLRHALPALGELPEIAGHRDLGKRLSSQMRYVPTVLAALEASPSAPGAES